MEELAEKQGYKETKMKKIVIRNENNEKEASRDDYI